MALFTTCENKTDLAWEINICQCPGVFSAFGMAYHDENLENWQCSMHSEGNALQFLTQLATPQWIRYLE